MKKKFTVLYFLFFLPFFIFANSTNEICISTDVVAFAFQPSCTDGIPNSDGYLQLSSVNNGDKVNWVIGSDYSNGDMDYNNAISIGGFPFKFATDLPNPTGSQDYTIRVFSGSSNNFTDVVLTMKEQDCTSGCDCQENLYLNDTGLGEVHKFSINPTDGTITEIGSPWMSGFSNPHGLGSDLNGNLYVGDDNTGPIYKVNCQGGTVANDATLWNTDIENGLTNIGSIDNYIITNAHPYGGEGKKIYVLDACSGNVLGNICLNNAGSGSWSSDWGLQVFQDGTILATDGQGWGPDSDYAIWKFTFDPSMINNPNVCIDALVVNDYLSSYYDIVGITKDDSHLYVLARDGGSNSTLLKIDATTGALVQSIYEGGFNGSGWNAALGLVYAPSSGYLYISGFEDCIAVVDPNNLQYIGPGNGTIPSGAAPKAISILTECCPKNNNVVIDTFVCDAGGLIFLQELTNCDGVICEGLWQEGSNNNGLTYNSCDNSVQITSPTGCGNFVLESDGLGETNLCGAFKITVNICVQDCSNCTAPTTTVAAIPPSCPMGSETHSGYLELINVTDGDKVNWIAGTDFSNGNMDYSTAIDLGALPFQIVDGLENPAGSQAYTIRIFNGSSDCFEDFTVSMDENDCQYAIGNYVWLDEDGDGDQDVGEMGIPGVVLSLKDNGGTMLQSVKTDFNGGYLFKNVEPGDYTVEVEVASLRSELYNQTFDAEGSLDDRSSVTITTDDNLDQDFGYNYAPASATNTPGNVNGAIGDRVWDDADSDGQQDEGEMGIGGVSVELLDENGLLQTATTDKAGNYIFDNLPAGAYSVNVDASSLPSGFVQIPTGDPDSDMDNESERILLAPGDVFLDMDFGYAHPATSDIGSLVFVDENANGSFDIGEQPIPGVSVALIVDANVNGIWDADELPTANCITDNNGNYLFPGLLNDNYIVAITDTDNVIGKMKNTADPDGGIKEISSVALNSADNLAQNFGYTPNGHSTTTGLIGDFIFLDTDGNNAFTVGESGLENVKVDLLDSNDNLIRTTKTSANGLYLFGGLAADTYKVKVDITSLPGASSIPNGLTSSVDPDGGNDNESVTTISMGDQDLDQDFGYKAMNPNTISGTIWEDADANGMLDENAPLLFEGVTVVLQDDQNNRIGVTATDALGDFEFTGLPDGMYKVDVTDNANVLADYWKSNGTNAGTDNNSQLDTYIVSVAGGSTNTTSDFGYFKDGASLGNAIWIDRNSDGIQDSDEIPMPLVPVTLTVTYPNGVVVTAVEITDAHGHYGFNNLLLDEDYISGGGGVMPEFELSVGTPINFLTTATDVNSNTNDQEDSEDPNGVTAMPYQGKENVIKLSNPNSEEPIASYDFGFTLDCSSPIVQYAVTNGAITNPGQTTNYFYQDTVQNLATYSTHIALAAQDGVIRSIDYCDFGNWSYYYNSSDPDMYLFAIEQGDNVTPIEYIELCVDDNPADRYAVGPTHATYVMARDWFVRTKNDAPLLDAAGNPTTVNIRFYFPEEEFKEILDKATDQAAIWGIDTPTVEDIYWFKKETFIADTDIDDIGSALKPFDINALRNSTTTALGVNTNDGNSSETGNGKNHIQFNGITGFSGGTAAITITNVALPVTLTNFDAIVDDCNVELKWNTQSEVNFAHYVVEQSSDGFSFESVHSISPVQSTANERTYNYNAGYFTKNMFYRLKMYDLDGSFSYSNIISANTDCETISKIDLYPNPVGIDFETITVDFLSNREFETNLIFLNALGIEQLRIPVAVAEGANNLEIDISNLLPGVYIVVLQNLGGPISSQKFLKLSK